MSSRNFPLPKVYYCRACDMELIGNLARYSHEKSKKHKINSGEVIEDE